MSAESSFVAILDAAATTASTRIYPMLLPETPTFPALTYQEVSGVPQQHRTSNTALDRLRYQVNCYGKTFEQARVLANEIRALNRASGGEISRILVEDTRDDFDVGTELYSRQIDLILWHTRA